MRRTPNETAKVTNPPPRHYTEADLLETWYMKPGEAMPVMMHLAECADCASRWETINRKLRGLRDCEHAEKPARRRGPLIAIAIAAALAVAVFTCSSQIAGAAVEVRSETAAPLRL
jgi:hypothetical protein